MTYDRNTPTHTGNRGLDIEESLIFEQRQADFFNLGSDPFADEVCFGGEALGVVTIPGFGPLDFDGADTLVRASQNVVLGPVDFVLTPIVTMDSIKYTSDTREYTGMQTFFYAPIAIIWIGGLNLAVSGIRSVAGLFELPVGLAVLGTKSFWDWEPEPFFDTSGNPAMFEEETDDLKWRFGVQYIGEGE